MKALLLMVAGIGGLVQALVPRPVVRAWTKATYRSAGEAEPREWVYAAVRVEGAMIVIASLVGLYVVATAKNDGPVVDGDGTDATSIASDPKIPSN